MRLFAVIALGAALSGCLHFHTGAMPGEPKTATFATVDGTRVRYVDQGSGPVVVLLHGFASSIENWALVMPELVKDYRVIALDLRGFGWTDRPEGDYSPEAQAKVAESFGEAPVNPKACALTTDKQHCAKFHAQDESWWKDVYYWTTPTADCGDDRGDVCKTQADWKTAWTEIRG